MPKDPEIDLIRRFYERISGGEVESLLELVDSEIELITPEGGLTGQVHGQEAARRMFASYTESFDEFRIEPESFIAGDRPGQYVALVRIRIRGRGSGIEFAVEPAHLIEVRNGRIARLQVFPNRNRAEAFEAAGLEPPA